MYDFITIWSQAGGAVEFLGAILFLIFVLLRVLSAYVETRKNREEEKKQEALRQQQAEQPRLRDREKQEQQRRQKRSTVSSLESQDVFETKNRQQRQQALVRELTPQGEGQRFEADPGTFDVFRLVTTSIEATVKPTLESMTGIYDAAPATSEFQDQPLTLDIQKLLARPEGIRQAVLLAEIFKRPEF